MSFDAMIVGVAVTVVFVAFAVVLAWADSQTRPSSASGREASEISAPQLRRRSF
jgi:hypothetical protein